MFFKCPWGGVGGSERSWAAGQQKQTHLRVIYGMRKAKGEIERLTSLVAASPNRPFPVPPRDSDSDSYGFIEFYNTMYGFQ